MIVHRPSVKGKRMEFKTVKRGLCPKCNSSSPLRKRWHEGQMKEVGTCKRCSIQYEVEGE